MRVSFLVYGVLYVAIEIVGNQLETVGWPQITPLDVAEALTDALLAIVICIALVVARRPRACSAGARPCAPGTRSGSGSPPRRRSEDWAEVVWDDGPIGVRSWRRGAARPCPPPVPGAPAGGTYYTPSTYSPPFPEEPGRQL